MRRHDSHDRQGQGGAAAEEEEVRRRKRAEPEVVVRQTGRDETGGETPLPVFLFPSELLFYSEERSSHRRVLTLYNPYSFTLSFKVLCTAPSLYRVVEAEGSVRAKSCVDLVVRHLDVSSRNWGRRDRFRLEVRGGGQVGEREIWAELRGGREGEEEERRRRKKGGTGAEESRPEGQQRALYPLLVPTHPQLQIPSSTGVRSVSQWVVCFCVSVLCVSVLMLPLHTDSSSVVPPCLHVSTNQKLACAYTLGLLTMVFLR
ncbi:motile sperm domain-containing protein 1-like isoform X1 [Genypterus blacodes]|uniref:motile sperm domain-containing protein 1-like isoform X1 n=1 Tax=Genypterus blacodes TaxID=154954 RepID=UPI003F773926